MAKICEGISVRRSRLSAFACQVDSSASESLYRYLLPDPPRERCVRPPPPAWAQGSLSLSAPQLKKSQPPQVLALSVRANHSILPEYFPPVFLLTAAPGLGPFPKSSRLPPHPPRTGALLKLKNGELHVSVVSDSKPINLPSPRSVQSNPT